MSHKNSDDDGCLGFLFTISSSLVTGTFSFILSIIFLTIAFIVTEQFLYFTFKSLTTVAYYATGPNVAKFIINLANERYGVGITIPTYHDDFLYKFFAFILIIVFWLFLTFLSAKFKEKNPNNWGLISLFVFVTNILMIIILDVKNFNLVFLGLSIVSATTPMSEFLKKKTEKISKENKVIEPKEVKSKEQENIELDIQKNTTELDIEDNIISQSARSSGGKKML